MSTPAATNGTNRPSGPTICVFCGARPGSSPEYLKAARQLAHALASQNATLVYGGGTTGLMGELARTLVELSGPQAVKGFIPEALLGLERQETSADGGRKKTLDELSYGHTTVVRDMHSRKNLMAQQVINGGPGSGFVALPGGYGTFEELMEVATWNQLGIHDKGIVVFNVAGYWDSLFVYIRNAVDTGFVADTNRDIMLEAKTADEVVHKLAHYQKAPGRAELEWDQK